MKQKKETLADIKKQLADKERRSHIDLQLAKHCGPHLTRDALKRIVKSDTQTKLQVMEAMQSNPVFKETLGEDDPLPPAPPEDDDAA